MQLHSYRFAIMKFGHGGYRQTLRRCCGWAFLTAFGVLLGPATVVSADECPQSQTTSPDTVCYTKSYPVKDLLSKLRVENGLSESAAKRDLVQLVQLFMAGAAGNRKPRQPEKVLCLPDSDQLVVGATTAGHQRAADALEVLRKFGTSTQVAIETRFVTIPDDELQKLVPDWSPLNVNEAAFADSDAVCPASFDRPLGRHEGTCVARAQLVIEKNPPVRFRILDKDAGEKLIQRCREDTRSNVLQAPKVTVFNGQTACVTDTSQSPFVVGVVPVEGQEASGARQPQLRVVTEGTMLQLRPIADKSGAIHLDFAATFSKVQKVETVLINRTPASGTTLQIPEVATARMEGGVVLKAGQWLLLGGSKTDDQVAKGEVAPVSTWLLGSHQKRQTQELVLMLRAEAFQTPRD